MKIIRYCGICGKRLYFGHCINLAAHPAIINQARKGGKRKGAGRKPKKKDSN